jgi:hypothetical protein
VADRSSRGGLCGSRLRGGLLTNGEHGELEVLNGLLVRCGVFLSELAVEGLGLVSLGGLNRALTGSNIVLEEVVLGVAAHEELSLGACLSNVLNGSRFLGSGIVFINKFGRIIFTSLNLNVSNSLEDVADRSSRGGSRLSSGLLTILEHGDLEALNSLLTSCVFLSELTVGYDSLVRLGGSNRALTSLLIILDEVVLGIAAHDELILGAFLSNFLNGSRFLGSGIVLLNKVSRFGLFSSDFYVSNSLEDVTGRNSRHGGSRLNTLHLAAREHGAFVSELSIISDDLASRLGSGASGGGLRALLRISDRLGGFFSRSEESDNEVSNLGVLTVNLLEPAFVNDILIRLRSVSRGEAGLLIVLQVLGILNVTAHEELASGTFSEGLNGLLGRNKYDSLESLGLLSLNVNRTEVGVDHADGSGDGRSGLVISDGLLIADGLLITGRSRSSLPCAVRSSSSGFASSFSLGNVLIAESLERGGLTSNKNTLSSNRSSRGLPFTVRS